MSLFDHVEFDQHEHVSYVCDPDSGLRAIIAIHNTHLGPAMGGTRYYPYQNDADALTDVLRLSRGMTYKSALARPLPICHLAAASPSSSATRKPRKHRRKCVPLAAFWSVWAACILPRKTRARPWPT